MCLAVITCFTLPDLNAAKAQEHLLDALFGGFWFDGTEAEGCG